MDYYYGLTIGPITKTIQKVKATRELWGASYLFSHLMGQILAGIKGTEGITILSPAATLPPEAKNLGTGLFPDRMYVKGNAESGKAIQEIIRKVIAEIGEEIARDLGEKERTEDVQKLLSAYFQTYLVRVQSETIPMEKLNELLDVAELRPPFLMKEPEEDRFLEKYFHAINGSKRKRTAFGEENGEIVSLPEIGVWELASDYFSAEAKIAFEKIHGVWLVQQKQTRAWETELSKTASPDKRKILEKKIRENEPEKLLDELYADKTLKAYLKNYHKYVAIIYADGDNIGATINALNSPDDFLEFSKKLLDFGVDAAIKIRDFGGFPVYIGGDDLLFFAPVKYKGKSVFTLAEELSDDFTKSIQTLGLKANSEPSLSFGVSLSYYKFPMHEALGIAHELLDGKAKKFPFTSVAETDDDKKLVPKKTLAIRLLKHSGNYFEAILPMGKGKVWGVFNKLVEKHLDKSERLLSSVAYKLSQHEALLHLIGKDAERIHYFFKENFNESIHKGAGKAYLDLVENLVVAAYEDADQFQFPEINPKDDPKHLFSRDEYALQTLYSLLRMLHFLNQDYHE
ncbi:MAG: type III-B CRISPR-associated protein Cas10/Cmr2 [Bacteroidia bacterium]|nr:type III-B CRISPR-associated protein Cas10/Cmr2 [Bacteroidia bacterium]